MDIPIPSLAKDATARESQVSTWINELRHITDVVCGQHAELTRRLGPVLSDRPPMCPAENPCAPLVDVAQAIRAQVHKLQELSEEQNHVLSTLEV